MCSPNPPHASDNTKCNSTCVDQITPISAKTQNLSKHLLTKPLWFQRGHKIYLNGCWPNPSLVSKDTKCITTCDDQTPPMPARTIDASQNSSNASEDTKCISACVDQIPPMSANTQNVSQHVLTKASEDTKCITTCVDQNPHIQRAFKM